MLGLRCPKAVPIHQTQQHLVPETLPPHPTRRLNDGVRLVWSEVVPRNMPRNRMNIRM
jgi:hypothetical protein